MEAQRKQGKKKNRTTTNDSPGQNQSRRSSDSDTRSGSKRNSIPELDADLAQLDSGSSELINNDSPGSRPQRNTLTDSELAELERELENEPEEASFWADTDWANDLLELDPSNPKNRQEIEEGIQDLIQQLEINQTIAMGAQAELNVLGDTMNMLASNAIEDIVSTVEEAGEIDNALSNYLLSGEEISDLDLERDLQERLNDLESGLDQIDDETIDRIIKAEENLDTLQGNNNYIVDQIRNLQEHLGVLRENEEKSKLSFGTRSKLKKAATTGMSVAPYLVPAAKQPVKIAGTALATISLAKTIRHIKNMRKMLDETSDPNVRDLIQYSIRQKIKKAARKGLTVAQVGSVGQAYSKGRALYKTIKGTRGEEREANARSLQRMAMQGNQEAADLVRELVGSTNMAEALDPTNTQGWEIIMSKLASA